MNYSVLVNWINRFIKTFWFKRKICSYYLFNEHQSMLCF